MLDPLSYVYLFLLMFYGFLLLSLKKAWLLLPTEGNCTQKKFDFSLLVPFRNERHNLPGLVQNLEQVIPASVQVVFINDHSDDGGFEWLKNYLSSSGKTNWDCINSLGIGKKQALKAGINASSYELIMTIDADVTLSVNWASYMLEPFKDREVQLVAGPVLVKERNSGFTDFQLIEWASLLLVSGAAFSFGNPVMCSGANLAFRKPAFNKVKGYLGNEHLLSGDDEFLLKKIHSQYGSPAVRYLVEKEALVLTNPWIKPADWINQRARWAGKWNLHGWNRHAFSAIGLVLLSLGHVSTFVFLFFSFKAFFLVVSYWTLKMLIEWNVLGTVLARFDKQRPFGSYAKASILHPVMVLSTLPYALLRIFTWKGRNKWMKS